MARRSKSHETPVAQNALANLARVFWDVAVRDVEAVIEAEEAAAKNNAKQYRDTGKVDG